MKFALVQYSPEWQNVENSIIKINEILKEQLRDEEVIVFPEMTLTGYTIEGEKFAEEIDGIGINFFINISRKYKKHIFAGIILREDNKIFNSLIHFDKDGLIHATYHKIHPFSYAQEEKYFHSSNEKVITQIDKKKFGLSICYDLRFPELYRAYGKQKVDTLINIANWPAKRIEHWKALLRARAIENLSYVIGVNRVGEDKFGKYCGCTTVVNPFGDEILCRENYEGIISVDIDFELVDKARSKYPFLDDIKLI